MGKRKRWGGSGGWGLRCNRYKLTFVCLSRDSCAGRFWREREDIGGHVIEVRRCKGNLFSLTSRIVWLHFVVKGYNRNGYVLRSAVYENGIWKLRNNFGHGMKILCQNFYINQYLSRAMVGCRKKAQKRISLRLSHPWQSMTKHTHCIPVSDHTGTVRPVRAARLYLLE